VGCTKPVDLSRKPITVFVRPTKLVDESTLRKRLVCRILQAIPTASSFTSSRALTTGAERRSND